MAHNLIICGSREEAVQDVVHILQLYHHGYEQDRHKHHSFMCPDKARELFSLTPLCVCVCVSYSQRTIYTRPKVLKIVVFVLWDLERLCLDTKWFENGYQCHKPKEHIYHSIGPLKHSVCTPQTPVYKYQ